MAVNADAVLVLTAHCQGLRRSRGGGLCAVTLIQFPRFAGEEMEVLAGEESAQGHKSS